LESLLDILRETFPKSDHILPSNEFFKTIRLPLAR
jgi:hypothetical protein